MLSGFDGVRYGLTVPKKEQKAGPKKGLSVFADDDSGDERSKVNKNIERQAQKKLSDQKVAKLQAAALSEDPSIFDYDSHFDTLQDQREAAKPDKSQTRKSRYIESLLDKTKERQRESDIIYERKLLRERKAEDHLFGDKDKFVTAAYKKKLEEDKKWLEEEAIREKKEQEEDVRKRGHMGDFYRNLLSNNVAFGTAKPKEPETKAQTDAEGSDRVREDEPAAAKPSDPNWEEMRRAREAYEARQDQNGAAESLSSRQEVRPEKSELTKEPQDMAVEPAGIARGSKALDAQESKAEGAELPPALSKEDKAAAAKERYLARKRKAPA